MALCVGECPAADGGILGGDYVRLIVEAPGAGGPGGGGDNLAGGEGLGLPDGGGGGEEGTRRGDGEGDGFPHGHGIGTGYGLAGAETVEETARLRGCQGEVCGWRPGCAVGGGLQGEGVTLGGRMAERGLERDGFAGREALDGGVGDEGGGRRAGDGADERGLTAGEGHGVAAHAQGVGAGRDRGLDTLGDVYAVGSGKAVGIGDDGTGGVKQLEVQVVDQRAGGVELGGVVDLGEDGAECALIGDRDGEIADEARLAGVEGLSMGGPKGAGQGEQTKALGAVGRGGGDFAVHPLAELAGIDGLRAEQEQGAQKRLVGVGHAQRFATPLTGTAAEPAVRGVAIEVPSSAI